jgi:hypothetical protein
LPIPGFGVVVSEAKIVEEPSTDLGKKVKDDPYNHQDERKESENEIPDIIHG